MDRNLFQFVNQRMEKAVKRTRVQDAETFVDRVENQDSHNSMHLLLRSEIATKIGTKIKNRKPKVFDSIQS